METNQKQIDIIKKQINLLNDFIYSEYKNLEIYSSSYFKDILLSIFFDANFPFTVIYGDVNKLSVINDQYGKKIGDEVLSNLLELCISPLPDDHYTIRAGGDEFFIVLPNYYKEQIEPLLSSISKNLEECHELLYGTTITLACEDSRNGNIEELIYLTEQKVSMKKHINEDVYSEFSQTLPIPQNISESQKSAWKTLNALIDHASKRHLLDLRPSDQFRYELEDIKTEAYTIIEALSCRIEQHLERGPILLKSPTESKISSNDASILHSLLTQKQLPTAYDNNTLLSLGEPLEHLYEDLVRNKQSGLLDKSYYRLFLSKKIQESNQNYQGIYFTLPGIRPSNTAYGHGFSDYRIAKTDAALIQAVSQRCDFDNIAFEFDTQSNYLIDMTGGNYLGLFPMENRIEQEEIDAIIQEVMIQYNPKLIDSTFQIVGLSMENLNPETIFAMLYPKESKNGVEPSSNPNLYLEFARYFKEQCNLKKDSLKRESLTSLHNQFAYEKVMENCVDFYCSEIEESDTISNKKLFLSNIFTSLIHQQNEFNHKMDKKEEQKPKIKQEDKKRTSTYLSSDNCQR